MTHPSTIDLEAFACGEDRASVVGHMDACGECRAFVDALRGFVATERPKAPALTVARAKRRVRASSTIATAIVLIPLAAAAALTITSMRKTTTEDAHVAALDTATATAPSTAEPETTFKGSLQVAVVRDRAGQQTRFTSTVRVRPGDRLRLEVALDREQAILGAVMGDDGSYLELMPGGVRGAGTHFSERSARIDDKPTRGTIVVGTAEAVARARQTRRFDGLKTLEVEWEGP